jgi:integrase
VDEEGLFARLVRQDLARNPLGQKVLFGEAVQKWLEGKEARGLKPRSLIDNRECIRPALNALRDRLVTEVTREDVEAVLKRFHGYRRRNVFRKIVEVFDECQTRKFMSAAREDHPCFGIKLPRIKKGLPTPITLENAARLLSLAVQTESKLGCTAWVAIRMFLGVRDSEAAKLKFGEVDGINIRRGSIFLSAEVAKKRERRNYIDESECWDTEMRAVIPPNLRRILRDLDLPTTGSLSPGRTKIDTFKKYARHCGVQLPTNCLRAGFASHHAAFFKDPKLSSRIMGHTEADGGIKVFYDHYLRFCEFEDGENYFRLGMDGLAASKASFRPPVTLHGFLKLG